MISYKGYTICNSHSTGGKAGKRKNKTATIQVRDYGMSGGYLLKRQIRYLVNNLRSRKEAIKKAKKFIDTISVPSLFL